MDPSTLLAKYLDHRAAAERPAPVEAEATRVEETLTMRPLAPLTHAVASVAEEDPGQPEHRSQRRIA